jgi:hypothetical protein
MTAAAATGSPTTDRKTDPKNERIPALLQEWNGINRAVGPIIQKGNELPRWTDRDLSVVTELIKRNSGEDWQPKPATRFEKTNLRDIFPRLGQNIY